MELQKKGASRNRIIIMVVLAVVLMGIVSLFAPKLKTAFTGKPIDMKNITEEQLFSENQYKVLLTGGNSHSKDGVTTRETNVKSLTGIKTVEPIKVENATLHLTVNSTCYQGDMRLFLIKNNAEVVQELTVGEEQTLEIQSEGENEYRVKVAGNHTDLEIIVSYRIEK